MAMNQELYQRVMEDYAKTQSVERTAKNCHCARVTAQKVLITEGLWSSRTSIAVGKLWAEGRSVKEIAGELHLTEKAVQAYTPYSRGMYGVETENARHSQDYRDRMNAAAERMAVKEDTAAGEEAAQEEVRDMHREWLERVEQEELRKPLTSDAAWVALSVSEEEAWRIMAEEQKPDPNDRKVYHLHLELQERDGNGLGCTGAERYFAPEEWEEFLKLAKAEQGISRDILVPGDMNLHALHYAIQQAFGWQNSHLHRFLLSEEDYDRLTAGRVGGYQDLVGILFRCENESFDDLYWDDDYRPEMSVKTWMKRKYSRPFRHYAATDTRYVGQRYTEEFRRRHPEITRDMRCRTLDLPFDFCSDLVEGLCVEDVFTQEGCRTWSDAAARRWKAYVMAEAADQEALFEDLELEAWAEADEEEAVRDGNARAGAAETVRGGNARAGAAEAVRENNVQAGAVWAGRDGNARAGAIGDETEADAAALDMIKTQLDGAVQELNSWRASRHQMERGLDADRQTGTKEFHRRIRRETGMTAERALKANEENVDYWTAVCLPLFECYVVRPLPFTNELIYNYDYGDDWWVRITLASDDNVPPELLDAVADKGAPVCIAADGLNLVDDVGGLGGFHEFLQTVYGDDPDEKAEMKNWARYLGWTGRRKKAENIL